MAETQQKKATSKPDAEQFGETYVVAWNQISLYVEPDEHGNRPEEIATGDGRKAKVVDSHVILSKNTPVAAASARELDRLRNLASIGALQAAVL